MLEARIRMALTGRLQVLSASDGVQALLGFTPEDFLASTVNLRDRIHTGDRDIAASLFSSEIPNSTGDFSIRLRHADGRIRCIKGHYAKEPASGGDPPILDLLLQDAKDLYRKLGAVAPIGAIEPTMEIVDNYFYFKDRNHVFTAANRKALLAFSASGVDGSSLIGQTDYDMFPEEFADSQYQLELEALAGIPVIKEYRSPSTWDDRKGWLETREFPVRDGGGEVVGLFAVAREITNRVKGLEKLRQSEESLRESQRIAQLGSYVTDIEKGEWASSEVMDQIFGIDKSYVRSVQGWVDLVHPEDQARMAAYLADEVLLKRTPFDREYRIVRHSDRAIRWVHGLGRLDLDAQGRPVKIHGTIQDITERKLIEESLKESQRIAGLGSYALDIPAGQWTSSEVLDDLAGIGPNYERTVAGWVALVHPDDREMWTSHYAEIVVAQSAPCDCEYRIVRQDNGAVRWVHALGRLECDAQRQPLLMRGTIQDITEQKRTDRALRESKDLLQLFIDRAPAALAMFDRNMRFLAASRRWLGSHGMSDREFVGRSHDEVLPDIPERWREAHRRGLAGENLRADEDRVERADGTVEWHRWEIIPWYAGDGTVGGIIIFSEDITRQKESEERLHLGASVFTHASEGIVIAAPDGAILDVNDAFTRITGYTREEVLGRNPRILNSGRHSKEFYVDMWSALASKGQWSGEIWNKAKNGQIYAELLTISAVHDANGTVQQYVALFSDMTTIKEQERKLEQIVHYDLLTGLPNRALLADRLRQAMVQSQRREQMIAVMCLDLDDFKAINERHGHEVGDHLLTVVAARMKHALREDDTLARLAGDEFIAVLLELPDVASSVPILNRLLQAAAEPVPVGDLVLQVSASIGVAFFPQAEDVDPEQLLRQADQAMYQAKLAGKNRYYIFDPGQDRDVRGHHEEREHIRRALAAGQFVLHYQPIVNMRTGAVVGAEALIRWQHPERGLLPPGLFLPAIEDHPLAVELGEWVIDSALAQMESWQASGLNMPLSVNVGARQLQQPDFVDRLGALLAAHPGVSPSSLELEVLETSALQDVVQVSKVFDSCAKIGVSFALDDFGTGYSSLTYLKRLPVHVLKIDRSFVRDMLDDPEDLSILEGVLGLASSFHRTAVAEGVETVEHGLMLLQLGCELAQGYGIARAMPANELPAWAAAWRPDSRWTNAPPMSSAGRALLHAAVEHRAWIGALEAFLKGHRNAPPRVSLSLCGFDAWLSAELQSGRRAPATVEAIDAVHRQIHAMAEHILDLHAHGRDADARAHLNDLGELGEALLERLPDLQTMGLSGGIDHAPEAYRGD